MIFTPGAIVGIVLFVGLAFGLLKIDHTIYGPDRDTYEKHMKKIRFNLRWNLVKSKLKILMTMTLILTICFNNL